MRGRTFGARHQTFRGDADAANRAVNAPASRRGLPPRPVCQPQTNAAVAVQVQHQGVPGRSVTESDPPAGVR